MEPFVGEIRIFAQAKPPKGWFACNGQTLQIQGNVALYALIGTIYGGDGKTTFQLPNLQGTAMVGQGTAKSTTVYQMKQNLNTGGSEGVVLTQATVPSHTHAAYVMNTAGTVNLQGAMVCNVPAVNFLTNENINMYTPAPQPPDPTKVTTLNSTALATTGAGVAHENRMPFQVLNICIAYQGYFPPRN